MQIYVPEAELGMNIAQMMASVQPEEIQKDMNERSAWSRTRKAMSLNILSHTNIRFSGCS